jgi:GTP cyclohydrolase I
MSNSISISERIKSRMRSAGKRFFACDNVSEFMHEGEDHDLVLELTEKFNSIIDSLVIDRENDPNSHDTGRRLAKMYVYEIMSGRYEKEPKVTAFPNTGENTYKGMLVVRAEIKSMCSHHHQPVRGVAYIGIIPGQKVIGLSKYIRIAQWYARRGQLQEELCEQIAKAIMRATDTEDVAVYIGATHGCCENRGVGAANSLTQTTTLRGQFHAADVKTEFFNNISLQQTLKG